MASGKIYSSEAYARGKMLDHSGWRRILGSITPSDIDMVFDFGGNFLFVELNSRTCDWQDLPYGQKLLYENLVRSGSGKHTCVLARHAIPPAGVQIDSVKDIISFRVMKLVEGRVEVSEEYPGNVWHGFVSLFQKKAKVAA